MIEYYQRPFQLFRQFVEQEIHKRPAIGLNEFWKIVPDGSYEYLAAKQLLFSYSKSLELKIKEIVEKKSIAYWLHLSRRIFPYTSGEDKRAVTVFVCRQILDAAFQKYGKEKFCDFIAGSKNVSLEKILNGLLLNPEFRFEKELIEHSEDQLVLTEFTQFSLLEYYQLEKMAYELWRTSSTLRVIAKGANLIVNSFSEKRYYDDRNDEIDFLIKNYDNRLDMGLRSTTTGNVYMHRGNKGFVLLPTFNHEGQNARDLKQFFKMLHMEVNEDYIPNFLLGVFPIKDFRNAHLPFKGGFEKKYDVSLDSVLFVITAMLFRLLHMSVIHQYPVLLKIMQRAYDPPNRKTDILEEIRQYTDAVKGLLELSETESSVNIEKGYEFLQLKNRNEINLLDPGPFYMFLPAGGNLFFTDFCWISEFLTNLFYGIEIDNQQFKGRNLELAVAEQKSILPIKPCRNYQKGEKQIDYATTIDDILVIVECKAVAYSFGMFRGDRESLNFRKQKVVERALNEVDDKAQWLRKFPVGLNYDVSKFKSILPVAVSPFIEYVDSLNPHYWINEEIPRILSLSEFEDYIDKNTFSSAKYNLVTL